MLALFLLIQEFSPWICFRYTSFTGDGPPVAGGPGPVNTTDWAFVAASYSQPTNTVTFYVDLDASTTADPRTDGRTP